VDTYPSKMARKVSGSAEVLQAVTKNFSPQIKGINLDTPIVTENEYECIIVCKPFACDITSSDMVSRAINTFVYRYRPLLS